MKKRRPVRSTSPIDTYIGNRIRQRRFELNISQVQLAKNVGVSFQQLQKYEAGTNRVSAARLFEICRVLDCSFSYMFKDDPQIKH